MSSLAKLYRYDRPVEQRAMSHVAREYDRIPSVLRRVLLDVLSAAKPWPLYVSGPAGCGKTCAALWLHDNTDACYVTAETLIRRAFDGEEGSWRVLAEKPLAIIDDLGLRSSDFDREYVALWRAAELRTAKPTVWMSNLTSEELHRKFDDRLFSRLCCGTVVRLIGDDQRFLHGTNPTQLGPSTQGVCCG